MTAVPADERVAWIKTSMKRYTKSELTTALRSPKQKSMTMNILKPITPLIKTLQIIERGTITAAFLISSLICKAVNVDWLL